jgi:hypothetical protein
MLRDTTNSNIRIQHKGNIIDNVTDAVFHMLEDFDQVDAQKDGLKMQTLNTGDQAAFAQTVRAYKYDTNLTPAPATER